MKPFDMAMLDALAALDDAASFDGAARLLALTQSAVSQRLQALESAVGQRLVVRARPLRFTEAGKVLLRHARQMQALRADLSRELGQAPSRDLRLPIAINADSLATWVPPALDAVVRQGQREGYGLELLVDDQDFTHEALRQGEVLGCVSTVSRALRGCVCQPLGAMRYVAVASPAFMDRLLPHGLTATDFARVPFIAFNRKDDTPAQWVARAFGVREPRLMERYVPSTEAGARAAALGWGVAVLPEILVRDALAAGTLVQLHPAVWIDIALYWHQWKLGSESLAPAGPRGGLMAQVGQALIEGARQALRAPDGAPAPPPREAPRRAVRAAARRPG